jgi:hypothetical protein
MARSETVVAGLDVFQKIVPHAVSLDYAICIFIYAV